MKRACVVVIALAIAASAHAGANSLMTALPVVGYLKSADPNGSSFVLDGPDGEILELELKEGNRPVHMRSGPMEWSALVELAGRKQPIVAFRLTPEMANLLFVTDDLTEPTKYRLRNMFEKEQLVELGSGGFAKQFRPAVNLGASDRTGAALDSAGWAWLEQHKGTWFKVRTVKAIGIEYIWSMEYFDPKSEKADER